MKLVYELFPEKDAKAIDSLWQERTDQGLLARQIGRRLMISTKPIISSPQIQLMSLLSQANFATTEEEPVLVAGMIRRHARDTDILPLITEHQGRGLGERCLLGLGLFYDAMYARYKRRSAPEPEFYREVGRESLRQAGVVCVAENFRRWEGFLGEVFN